MFVWFPNVFENAWLYVKNFEGFSLESYALTEILKVLFRDRRQNSVHLKNRTVSVAMINFECK